MRLALLFILCLALAACSAKTPVQKGGVKGAKPYTVLGKTYYPLKSAHGFLEEGVASWYGPGFHGKKTANGETYNQYAMTAAHKILPLGTQVRVTNLDNDRSVIVRVNDRGPFVADRVIDLSRAAATRLGMMGKGTATVRVQSLGGLVEVAQDGDIKGDFYIQLGAFGSRQNAQKLIKTLAAAGNHGRLLQGANKMWNVQAGPWKDSAGAQAALAAFLAAFPGAFVVSAN